MKRKVPVQKGKLKLNVPPSMEMMTPKQAAVGDKKADKLRRSGQKLKKSKRY